MAELDSEEPSISLERVNLHLKNCENCRNAVERMRTTDVLLRRMERRDQTADLWATINARIEAKEGSAIGWVPFFICGVVLVIHKLLEMLLAEDFGLAFKLMPLVFIVLLFALLRENPFKINAELAHREIFQ